MRVTAVVGMMRSSDRDERGDAERKRFELFLKLIEGMNVPEMRIESLHDINTQRSSLRWLDRNLGVRNSNHKDFQRARNILNLLLKNRNR